MARPSVPTASELLARPSIYNIATSNGSITDTPVTRTSSQLGNDRTVDARGWLGRINGGTPASTGGTTPNFTPLTLSNETDGTSKPLRLAVVGSLTTTPTAQVGAIEGMLTSQNNRYPFPATESWGHLKNLDGWTGPDFDAHAMRVSYNSTVTSSGNWTDTNIGAVISGMRLTDCMDGIFIGTAPTSYLLEHSYINGVRDDAIECDWSNTPGYIYKCLIDGSFAMYSTRGTANRSSLTTTFEDCVIVLRRDKWRPSGVEAACTYAAYGNIGGFLGGNGAIDKRNANSPKMNFINCTIYVASPPVGASACDGAGNSWATLGFKDSTHCTASGTTLLWARCPDHPDFPKALTSDVFIPSGMTVTTYQGNEQVLTNAIQTFHNEHPQFGLASGGGGGPAEFETVGMLSE